MAGDAKKLQPIIIKKIKKGGHAAHGGAWKIAYADFVTAMMAFFLLMWLLGSTTDGDKKGIADYFKAPLKISLMGGAGSGDATSIIKGGGTDLSRSGGQVKRGDVEVDRSLALQTLREQQAAAERIRLQGLRDKVDEVLANSPRLAEFKSQIRLDMTRDGLRIQIVDDQKRAMFDSGSAEVKSYMREILRAIGAVLTEVPNRLTLEGHTDALPFSTGQRGYSNWELSSDRANASRRELLAGGLDDQRILRVQGLAASVPFDRLAPADPVNRRISIIVMTRDAVDRFFQSGDSAEAAVPSEPGAADRISSPSLPPPINPILPSHHSGN
ncbi:MAG: flagellar motor protein MotB [Leptothrix sp. (in: b-proteobacteria)]